MNQYTLWMLGITMNELEVQFDWVRKTFFPHREKGEIQCCEADDLNARATTDFQPWRKRIWISEKEIGKPIVTPSLIIHEMCHIEAGLGAEPHGEEWQAAMEQAIREAEKLGLRAIARWLRRDIEEHRRDPLTGKELLARAEIDTCLDNQLCFDPMLDRVAERCGVTRLDVILCKSLRRTIDDYKRNLDWRKNRDA
jgi:hypothetical protein